MSTRPSSFAPARRAALATGAVAITVASQVCAAPAIAPAREGWQLALTPYLWAPAIGSTLYFGDRPDPVARSKLSSPAVLDHVDRAGMITGQWRNGRWGGLIDLLGVSLADRDAWAIGRVDMGGKVSSRLRTFTGAATYALVQQPGALIDGLIGARYLDTRATLDFSLSSDSVDLHWSSRAHSVDPIVGVKGRVRLGEGAWFAPFYADVGGAAGKTSLTWQTMVGVGHAFDWGDLELGYRTLYYDMKAGYTLQDSTNRGFALGTTLRF